MLAIVPECKAIEISKCSDFLKVRQEVRKQIPEAAGWPNDILLTDVGAVALAQALHDRGAPIEIAAIYAGRWADEGMYGGTTIRECVLGGYVVKPLPSDTYDEIKIGDIFHTACARAHYHARLNRRSPRKQQAT